MRSIEGMRLKISSRLLLFALATGFAMGFSSTAEAKGTFFLLELNSGVGESAYSGGGPGLTYGASAGLTFRIPATNLRYHLLGSVVNRTGSETGKHNGTPFIASRRDTDLFVANRIVLPVWRMIRVYGELGLGTRLSSAVIDRSGGFDALRASQSRWLLVTAVGVQARVSKHFSVGLRGELIPIGAGPDLATFAASLQPNAYRMGMQAQLGVHF